MIVYLLIVIFSLVILHVVVRYGRMGRIISTIPAAKPLLPVIGSAPALFFNADQHGAWNILQNLFEKYYPILNIWSVTYPTILIWDPKDVKIILNDKVNINKSSFYDYLTPFARTGLVTAGGEKWRERRKLLNPAFHVDVLKKYLEVSNEHSREFIEYMRKLDDNNVQNISSIISKLILNIMTETSMGVHHKLFEEGGEDYEGLVKKAFEIFAYRTFRPYIPNWLFQFLSVGRLQKKVLKDADNFANKLIDKRKVYHESTGYEYIKVVDTNDNNPIGRRKNYATLDRLLLLEKQGLIDKAGILEEVQTFIAAAHDTTTTALIFHLLALAENEEVQEKARKEAIEVIDSSKDGSLTMEDIKKLEYIDRCTKESLRLYPAVPMVGRRITHDLKLTNHTLPAGTDLGILSFHIHRNPKHWSDPLKFDPDRFLPNRIKNQESYSYIPFSVGPRNCIGQKLAQMTLKALVARILYNFKLEPVTRSDEIKFEFSVVLKAQNPIYVRFIKINEN